jgi:hypothetical protein
LRGSSDASTPSADELAALRPFLGLAREIKAEVDRLVADDGVTARELEAGLDALPAEARARVTREAFARLAPDQQWNVILAAFGDDEVKAHLAAEHEAHRAEAARNVVAKEVARAARATLRLDTSALPAGHDLVVGLFRPVDVHAGLTRGIVSEVCARQLVLRTTDEPGRFQVLDDLFNPRHGFFVSGAYDQTTWKRERLLGHQRVELGSMVDDAGTSRFELALYPGGRVDARVDGDVRLGTLLLGFATFGDEDVFTPTL